MCLEVPVRTTSLKTGECMTSVKHLLCSFLFAFLAVAVSAQQITGNIHGTVTDSSGAVVQSAAVTVKDVDTSLTRTTKTDQSGSYLLLELPVGRYQLEVTAQVSGSMCSKASRSM